MEGGGCDLFQRIGLGFTWLKFQSNLFLNHDLPAFYHILFHTTNEINCSGVVERLNMINQPQKKLFPSKGRKRKMNQNYFLQPPIIYTLYIKTFTIHFQNTISLL